MKIKTILGLLLFSLILISACSSVSNQENNAQKTTNKKDTNSLAEKNNAMKESDAVTDNDWKSMTLKDVKTGEEFSVDDFKGKTVLLESFAVWCPTCTNQQKINQEFHKSISDVMTIALDTDPQEVESIVLNHINKNEFQGFYAVAPKEYTQSLIDEFGVGIVNAPSVPMILICEDGSTRLLEKGIKSVETLQQEIIKGCT